MAAAWQRPYLNIFKHFRVEEWKRSAKEGDVVALTDARLKGTVYRIRGSLPASSYLQLPRTGTQSLGLVGRYLYLLFKPIPCKHFVVHLDVTTEEIQVVRISFSNLFKEFKSTATWLQFPFVCRAAEGSVGNHTSRTSKRDLVGAAPADVRWTCLVLDLHSILSLYLNRRYSHLKSVKLCSNLLVKTLCTSDLVFIPGVSFSEARQADLASRGVAPMPRDMAFPVPKGQKWHDLYDYIRFPSEGSKLPYDSIQKSCPSPVAGGQDPEDPVCQLPQPVTLTKAVRDRLSLVHQLTSPKAMPRRSPIVTKSIPEVHLAAPWPPRAVPAADQELEKNQKLRGAGHSGQPPAVTDGGIHVYAHQKSERPIRAVHTSSEERLLPDPILKLRRIIGFGGCSTKWALWTQSSSVVIYPCHAVIVALQIQTGEQRFFIGHTDKVSSLAFNGNSNLLASAQSGPLSIMRLWDFPTGSCLSVFKPHIRSILSLSFSYSGAVLCAVGKDGHGKTMVVVWNTAQVTRGGEVAVLAKAHTDVDIQALKIAFFDDTRMVSCGRDNIRLWRVRSGALRSCPVNLGEYHSLEFTDLAFEEGHTAEREPEDRTLFVCSKSGHVLEVDYKNICVRSTRRLLPAQPQGSQRQEKAGSSAGPGIAINSISISSSFCATGSEDGYLRLWPLDFSAVILEAEHEAPVSCVSISPDSRKVLCTTAAGNLGCLDIQSRDYNTLMRSHEDSILAFSVEGVWKQLATVSQDHTIRIWDLVSMEQLYDFTAAEEMPCAVAFHPTQQILACGFDSGMVRIFSLAASDLLVEHKQHRTVVTGLTFSPDGKFMFSSCLQGTLALYSCVEQKSHIQRVLGNVVARDGGSSPDALVVSEDSRLLAFVGPSKHVVTVMEACSLDELLRVDISVLDVTSTVLDSAVRLCFAPVPQGELLVSTASNKILVLDAETGRLVREVSPVHKLSCSSLALSNDGRYLLTAGDKVIKVWDYQMRFDVNFQVYIGHSEPVHQVAFTPDQRHVISVGDAIFLWDFLALPAEGSPPAEACFSKSALLLGAEGSSEELKDASDIPRQTVPLPFLSSPPCLDVSSVHQAGCQSIFSESDKEEEAALPVCSRMVANGDKDASVLVVESVRSKELIVRPKVRQESSRSPRESANEPRKETKSPKSRCSIRPDSYRHFTPRFKASALPQSFLSPPAGREVLKLKAVIGYNGNGRGNMVWDPDTGFFAYTCGCIIVVEDLHSGSQSHWFGHVEEISTLAISHDGQVLASASGRRNGDSHCQICIWNVQDGVCTASLFHHETQIQAMAFSQDDRFLVTVGDYSDRTIALWNTCTYELMSSTLISEPVHDMAFSPFSHRELACVGTGAVMFWLLEEQGADVNLKVHRAPAPDVLGPVELTSLCHGDDAVLYSGTNSGQICVWDTETKSCFMMWEADEGEIGVLVCGHNRLVSGSNTKRIRLWAVAAMQELRLKGPDTRSGSVMLEHEITLDGTIVSAAFDNSLEIGIVGTTAGTLWYINWIESTSIRLISGHKNKVTEVCFSPDETHCVTCGEDGSVRIWSLGSMELVVQFQVLNQSCQCLAWKPRPVVAWGAESQHVVAGYSDGTIRVFSISRTEMELKMHPHAMALTAIAYSTDGEMILSGAKDGLVAVSNPRTGMTIRVLTDHKGSPITVLQCTRKQVSRNVALEAFMIKPSSFTGMTCTAFQKISANSDKSMVHNLGSWEVHYHPDQHLNFKCNTGNLNGSLVNSSTRNAVAVASVHLPQSVFSQSSAWQSVDNSTCKLQFIVFRNGKLFPSTGNSSNLADDGKRRTVATPAVFAKIDGCSFGNLTSPLTIGLRHFAQGVDPIAAFWDFDLLDGHGGWWGEGCHIISSAGNITTIQSTRFSNFAVLMDFKTVLSFPQYPGEFLHPVVYACTAVMLLCLFASIITYIVHHSTIRISRKGWHMLLNFCFHTALTFAVFAGGINRIKYPIICQAVGIVLHYSTLSTMLWIGVTARNIYKQVTKKPQPCQNSDQPSYPKQPLLRFYLISGGVPFIICGITAATNINNYGIEGNAPYCWMAWEPSLGAFYGPVAFIVLVTCVYFLCTYVQLKRHPERKYELKEKKEDPQRMPSTEVGHGHITDPVSVPQATCSMISSSLLENEHSFKAQLRAAAFTLFLFTATWTFGALAVSQGHFLDMIFSCLYGAFCVTLGLFILIHHCAKRDDVWHCWWSCCPSRRNTYSVQVNVRPKVNVNGDTQAHAPCLQESPCPNKSAVFNHPAASHCKLTNLQAVQNHVNCLSPVTPCCAKMHCDQLLDDEAHIHVHNEGSFRPNMHIHRCLKSRTKPRYFSRHRSAGEREYAYHIPSSIDGSIHSSHTDSPHSTHDSQSGHRRACCSKSDPYPTVNQPESSDASTVIYSCAKMTESDTAHHPAHFEMHARTQSLPYNTTNHNGILKGNMHEAMIYSSDSTGNIKTGPWKNETTV